MKVRRGLMMALGLLGVLLARAELLKVHVLPLAFSAESRRNYGEWIERLEAEGYGQAVWQELEEILYDEPQIELIQSPLSEREFTDLVRAHAERDLAEGEALFELPEQVISINANVFQRAQESLSLMRSSKTTEYEVTLYLRFYDLKGGRLNRAVPARGSGVATSPVEAARIAVRAAAATLLQRLRSRGVLAAEPD